MCKRTHKTFLRSSGCNIATFIETTPSIGGQYSIPPMVSTAHGHQQSTKVDCKCITAAEDYGVMPHMPIISGPDLITETLIHKSSAIIIRFDIMVKKFLYCFPLRLGNLVFGYIVVLLSLATAIYHLYMLITSVANTQYVESKSSYDEKRNIMESFVVTVVECMVRTLGKVLVYSYFLYYTFVAVLLFFFAVLFTVGVHKGNYNLVTLFLAYCFCHLFLTLFVLLFEVQVQNWIQTGLVATSDLLLMLFMVDIQHLRGEMRIENINQSQRSILHPLVEDSEEV